MIIPNAQFVLPGVMPPIVTIIDDDVDAARAIESQVQDIGGFQTRLITEGPFQDVSKLASEFVQGQTCVLCDHRLSYRGLASFYGAEFVAYCNQHQTPALLLTQFSEQDVDVSIRRYRRHVPVLLPRHDLSSQSIQLGLTSCWQELRGDILANRRPYRTLVEIVELKREDDEDVADALIPGWKTDVAVRFPMGLIENKFHSEVKSAIAEKKRAYLFAQVNIGADSGDELFFEDFELAALPDSGFALDKFAEAEKAKGFAHE